MFRSASLFIGTSFTVAVFTTFATSNVDSIVGIPPGYSPQIIFNAKNFNPHKKLISLLNVPICTQGMQRTWRPEAGTIIYYHCHWTLLEVDHFGVWVWEVQGCPLYDACCTWVSTHWESPRWNTSVCRIYWHLRLSMYQHHGLGLRLVVLSTGWVIQDQLVSCNLLLGWSGVAATPVPPFTNMV